MSAKLARMGDVETEKSNEADIIEKSLRHCGLWTPERVNFMHLIYQSHLARPADFPERSVLFANIYDYTLS